MSRAGYRARRRGTRTARMAAETEEMRIPFAQSPRTNARLGTINWAESPALPVDGRMHQRDTGYKMDIDPARARLVSGILNVTSARFRAWNKTDFKNIKVIFLRHYFVIMFHWRNCGFLKNFVIFVNLILCMIFFKITFIFIYNIAHLFPK